MSSGMRAALVAGVLLALPLTSLAADPTAGTLAR